MNLWGGRFTKPTDQLVYDFNASISFDQTFYTQDIQGSIAHVKMLAKQGILTSAEGTEIETALNQILEDLNTGKLTIDNSQEDIHSFVESTLIERIGNTGKKLHTQSFTWIFKSIVPKCGYGGGSLWLRAGAVWMESDRL